MQWTSPQCHGKTSDFEPRARAKLYSCHPYWETISKPLNFSTLGAVLVRLVHIYMWRDREIYYKVLVRVIKEVEKSQSLQSASCKLETQGKQWCSLKA